MGYNTTIIVYNDALGEIERDPHFGKNLAHAIREHAANHKGMTDFPSGNHVNAGAVIESHHADITVVVAVGQNLGTKVGISGVAAHAEPKKILEYIYT